MIRVQIDDSGYISECVASGDPLTIGAELAAIACNVYAIIKNSDEDSAELFKETVQLLTGNGGKAWETRHAKNVGRGICVLGYGTNTEITE